MRSNNNGLRRKFGWIQCLAFIVVCSLAACTIQETNENFTGTLPRTPFLKVAAQEAGINFQNKLVEADLSNIIDYLYFYNGGGVVLADFVGDSLPDVFLTANQGANRLYENLGNWKFKEVSDEAIKGQPGWTSGATIVDINSDGLQDIYVCYVTGVGGVQTHNELLVNMGNGRFRESAKSYGLDLSTLATQASFFDVEGDGDLDVYILNQSSHTPENYADTSQRVDIDTLAGDKLLIRKADKYVDASKQWGIRSSRLGYGLGLLTADFNNDGYTDIFVGNDFHENDYLYINQEGKSFVETGPVSFAHNSTFSMGCDAGDINRDGLLDIVTLDMAPYQEQVRRMSAGYERFAIYELKRKFGYHHQLSRNMIHLSIGALEDKTPVFQEAAPRLNADATDWSWSPLLFDFTEDGIQDLYITNGIARRPNDLDYLNVYADRAIKQGATSLQLATLMPSGIVADAFLKNLGSQNIQWSDSAQITTGAAYADLDGDGDLDIVGNSINGPVLLLQNTNSIPHLSVKLVGPTDNPNGLGGTIFASYEEGATEARAVTYTRGFQSASQLPLTFKKEGLKSVCMRWPGGKEVSSPVDKASSLLLSFDDQSKKSIAKNSGYRVQSVELGAAKLKMRSFNAEPLRLLPSEPMHTVISKVNLQNGSVIVFDGAGTSNGLHYYLLNQSKLLDAKPKTFIIPQTKGFVSADIHPDFLLGNRQPRVLVIPSTIDVLAQMKPAPMLLFSLGPEGELIYLRTLGEPRFTVASTVGDLNGDGRDDIIRAFQKKSTASFSTSIEILLMGDAQIEQTIIHDLPGNVKALEVFQFAAEQKALAIAGQWMPISILSGAALNVAPAPIASSGGFWQSITALDINGDGIDELFAGNIGEQTRLRPEPNAPLRLYVNDFDRNGSEEPIATYARDGEYWTFLGKDPIMERMPMLRKIFPDYRAFAVRKFNDLFPPPMLEGGSALEVHTLKHTLLKNEKDGWVLESLPVALQDQAISSLQVLEGGELFVSPAYIPTNPEFGHTQTQSFYLLAPDCSEITLRVPVDNSFGQLKGASVLKVSGKTITVGLKRHRNE